VVSVTRAQWRHLAGRLRAAFNTRRPAPIPPRLELDLWIATEQRIAARRTRWF